MNTYIETQHKIPNHRCSPCSHISSLDSIFYLILPDKCPRGRVDKLHENRQLHLKIADRCATDVNARIIREKRLPLRRNTEVIIHNLDEYLSCQKARTNLQNPGVAFLLLFLFSYLTSPTTVCQPLPIGWSFPKMFCFALID